MSKHPEYVFPLHDEISLARSQRHCSSLLSVEFELEQMALDSVQGPGRPFGVAPVIALPSPSPAVIDGEVPQPTELGLLGDHQVVQRIDQLRVDPHVLEHLLQEIPVSALDRPVVGSSGTLAGRGAGEVDQQTDLIGVHQAPSHGAAQGAAWTPAPATGDTGTVEGSPAVASDGARGTSTPARACGTRRRLEVVR